MRDRLQLEAERQHVGSEARLDDLVEVDMVGGEVREPLLEEADDGPQGLQVVRDAQVIECDRHGGPPCQIDYHGQTVIFPLETVSVVRPPAPQPPTSRAMRHASACEGKTRARGVTVSMSPRGSTSSASMLLVPISLPCASRQRTRPRMRAGPLGCVRSVHDDPSSVMRRSPTPPAIGSDDPIRCPPVCPPT